MLSLCSGIGGIDLAAEWAGFEIAGQIEKNAFCQMILRQHWPTVPLLSDVKEVALYEKEELESVFGAVDLVAGGIPCQPFSFAGKRRGTADDRHLWPSALALIKKLEPSWVLIENVRGFVSMALDLVLSDLEALCYETQAFVFPACATGTPHTRERCFVLAYSSGVGQANAHSDRQRLRPIQHQFGRAATTSANLGNDGQERPLANPDRQSLAVGQCLRSDINQECQATQRIHNFTAGGAFAAQSRMGRVLDGISTRLDTARWPASPGAFQEAWEPSRTITGRQQWRRQRLEALGNAVNPYQVYPFLALIKECEEAA